MTGLVDLTLVAHEFGRHAAPGPLAATNVVAAALSDIDGDAVVRRSSPGCSPARPIATWCHAEPPPHDRLGDVALEVRVDGDERGAAAA